MSMKAKIHIGVENPLILNNTDSFWMVISGEVNVFHTKIDENGEYLCALKYLYSAKQGELLFSLLPLDCTENIRLIVFSNDAKLLAINKSDLLDIDRFFLKNMINKWISKTSSELNSQNAPRVYTPLDDFTQINLKENSIAYPSHGVNWVNLNSGSLSVFSDDAVVNCDDELNFPIPVSNKLWIKSLSDTTEVKILSTREVIEEEVNFLISLEKIQAHFYTLLAKTIENNSVFENEHFKAKLVSEEDELKNTLEKIKSIVTGSKKSVPLATASKLNKQSLLYSTCQVIAEHSQFKFEEPKHIDPNETSAKNLLYAIAKSSKTRVRKIILRDVWWKEENGNLLAFTKQNDPVALIQKTSSSYLIKNLADGSEAIVNNEIAASLEPIGYMFFSGFNVKMDSMKKVLNFAMNGVKSDAKMLILASLAGSLIGLLVPILSGVIFDDVIPTADRSIHFEIFSIMIVIGLVTAGLQLVQGVLQMRVESKSSINLQAGVMDYILRLPVTFYKRYTAGDLTNRILSINSIRQILSNTLMTAVLSGAFSFVNLILLFYYDSSLAWVGIGLALGAVAFMILIGCLKLKYDREVSKYQGEIQGFLFEFLSGISKIRITGGERRVFTLWAAKFSKLKQLGFSSGNYQNFVEIFNSSYPLFTSIFFFSFIYYTVIHATTAGSTMMTVGSFMAFITAFNKFLGDSLRLSMAFITSLNVIPLYERVKPILEEEPESMDQSIDPGELAGDIEMNSVCFRYNENQPLILKNITFKIKPGEMVAFVGPSGSGKSTIMRLLLGFEHAEMGSIFYDGNSFDTMNKELVRRQIGVVLQNGALMAGSIYQNIVGNSELTLDDAWDAARMAGMEEDIKNMPMEMHTLVSEGAGTFSGGQRQRLMIARAIVHKPRLLFMDEATSALDNRTQNIVAESLDKLQATRIVIAHRLSTIKNADRIYVLDNGEITESGTYEELMQKDGLFTQLAKRQIS